MFALVVCLLVELNAFFLLNTLSIPKESNFNAYRLSLVFLIGIPGAAEVWTVLRHHVLDTPCRCVCGPLKHLHPASLTQLVCVPFLLRSTMSSCRTPSANDWDKTRG